MKFEGRDSEDEFGPASFRVTMNSRGSCFRYFIWEEWIRGCCSQWKDERFVGSALRKRARMLGLRIVIIVRGRSFMAKCVQCGRQLPALSFGKKLCQWCVQHEAAQRGEDSPVQRVEAAPWMRPQSSSMAVTQAIFGINVAVFVAMVLALAFRCSTIRRARISCTGGPIMGHLPSVDSGGGC